MSRLDEKHVFAVWGAPNGGKSTVAVNMATVLADSGFMTCLVSAADHGELQAFFQAAIPRNKGLYAAISNGRNVREALTEARPNLCLLELDTGGDTYEVANISPDQVNRIITELRDQFSYVIIDCTNYKDAIFTGLGLVEADKVVVCIPHRVSAATWHIANEQMLDAVMAKTVYVDANIHEGGADMEQLLESIGLQECPIKINRVRSAFYCENTGNVIVLQGGREERKYKKAIMDLIQMLLSLEEETKRAIKKDSRVKEEEERPSRRGLFGGRGKAEKAEKAEKPEKNRGRGSKGGSERDLRPRRGKGKRDEDDEIDDVDDEEEDDVPVTPRRRQQPQNTRAAVEEDEDDDEEEEYQPRRRSVQQPSRDSREARGNNSRRYQNAHTDWDDDDDDDEDF